MPFFKPPCIYSATIPSIVSHMLLYRTSTSMNFSVKVCSLTLFQNLFSFNDSTLLPGKHAPMN